VGIVGITSVTLIGIRHLGQSCTSPGGIVLSNCAVMGDSSLDPKSTRKPIYDQEVSRAPQHDSISYEQCNTRWQSISTGSVGSTTGAPSQKRDAASGQLSMSYHRLAA
jgi:hypothetical protein